MGKARGYTLIELMMVVAILGILSVIAIPNFVKIIDRARDSSTKSALGALRSAISMYYADTEGLYPEELSNKPVRVEMSWGGKRWVSFLPSSKHEGYFPADPDDPSRPYVFAKLRRGLKNNVSNEVTYVGGIKDMKTRDGKKAIFKVSENGGWLYIRDKDGAILLSENGPQVVVERGSLTINHSGKDATETVCYYEY